MLIFLRLFIDDEKAAPFSNFRLSLSNSMHLVYEASIGPDKTFSVCSSNTKLTALKWTHVALVQSNETVTFYIDGDCGWFVKAAIHPSMSCRLLISNPTTCLGLGEKDFESDLPWMLKVGDTGEVAIESEHPYAPNMDGM